MFKTLSEKLYLTVSPSTKSQTGVRQDGNTKIKNYRTEQSKYILDSKTIYHTLNRIE